MTKAQKIEIADPELITAFCRALDASEDTGHVALKTQLGRSSASNTLRALQRAEEAGNITIDPPHVPEETRRLLVAAGMLDGAPGAGQTGEIQMIETARLRPSPLNPRKTFNVEAIEDLAAAILSEGLIHNLMARPDPQNAGGFELVAGERRYRAIELLKSQGRKSDKFDPFGPVEVRVKSLDDAQVIMLAISENMDRVDPHPLEEAEAFLRLRDLRKSEGGDDAADKATAEIAEMIGKSRRFVQLRIALAEKLAPEAAEAFRNNEMSLAQARALATTTQAFQVAATDNIKSGWHGYRTAEEILERARGDAIDPKIAFFPLEQYDGEVWKHPESGTEYFANVALFDKLQDAAMKKKRKELLAKSPAPAFVTISENFYRWDFEDAKGQPKDKIGYIITKKHDRSVEVHRVGPRKTSKPTPQDTKRQEAKKLEEATGEEGVKPYERRHIIAGRTARTAEVQHTLATHAHYKVAAAIAIIATLPSVSFMHDATCALKVDAPTGDDRGIFVGGQFAAMIEKKGEVAGLTVKGSEVFLNDRAKALRALVDHPALFDFNAAAIADRIGTAINYNGAPGDSDYFRAIADLVGVQHVGQNTQTKTDKEYFARFSRGTLAMIAKRAGFGGELPAKKADAVDALAKSDAATRFIPPEWYVGGDLETEADIAAMLRGEDTPKPSQPKTEEAA